MSKSIRLNAFFKTLMSIVNIIFPLITAPYAARVLSVDGFTEYNKAVSMIGWFSPFAVFGIYTYGMRSISRIKNNTEKVSALFTRLFCFNIFTAVCASVAYLVLIFSVPSFIQYRRMYVVFTVQLLFVCFATDWVCEAFESYGFILIKTFFCRLLYIVSVFIFVRRSDDIFLYVVLSCLSLLFNNVLTFAYTKKRICFVKIKFRETVSFSKPLFTVFLLVNSSMLYTIFDRFVLVWFGDKLNLTYYTISQIVITALVNVTTSVLLVTIPRLSFYWANGRQADYYALLGKSSSTFLALHTPFCIGTACLSFEVIYFYAGTRYLAASASLFLFSLRYYISAFDMILAKQVLFATGNERLLTKIYYTGGIYNIFCKVGLVFMERLSPELCIITTASSDLLVILLQIFMIRKLKLRISLFPGKICKYLLTSLLFIPVVASVRHFIPFAGIHSMFFRCAVSVLLCSALYATMLFITKDDFIKIFITGTSRQFAVPEERAE